MSSENDREGAAPAVPSTKARTTVDWTAVRRVVRCQRDRRDRDDIIEWKQPGECLYVEDRLPWLMREHEAEEGDE